MVDERFDLKPEEYSMTLLEDLDMPAEQLLNNMAFRLLLNMKYHQLFRHVLKKYRNMFRRDPPDDREIHNIVIEIMNEGRM